MLVKKPSRSRTLNKMREAILGEAEAAREKPVLIEGGVGGG